MCAVPTAVVHRPSVKRPLAAAAAVVEVRVSLHKAAVPEVAVMGRRRASRVPRAHPVRALRVVTDRLAELEAVAVPEEQVTAGMVPMAERVASE